MRKQKQIEKGITEIENNDGTKSYKITVRDPQAGKYKGLTFRTIEAARTARKAEQARVAERKRLLAARTPEEKRAANLERNGDNSALERNVLVGWKRLPYTDLHINNDFTRSDALLGARVKKLPFQLKVTAGPEKGQPNTWHFKHTRGYKGMPVVVWRDDKNDGWVFDGELLDKRKSDSLAVTPGGKYAKMALSGTKPLTTTELFAFLSKLEAECDETSLLTVEEASWDFKSINHFKERVGIAQYTKDHDPDVTFPTEQAGSSDLVAGGGMTSMQFKTARTIKGKHGLLVDLKENAGKVDNKPTYRPYSEGSFETLVVYHFDWIANLAHCWIIPESELIEQDLLKTATCAGQKSFYVYTSVERQSNLGRKPDTWTAHFYGGATPIVLSETAERMGKTFLTQLRGKAVAEAPSASEASSSSDPLPAPAVGTKRPLCFANSDDESDSD